MPCSFLALLATPPLLLQLLSSPRCSSSAPPPARCRSPELSLLQGYASEQQSFSSQPVPRQDHGRCRRACRLDRGRCPAHPARSRRGAAADRPSSDPFLRSNRLARLRPLRRAMAVSPPSRYCLA